MRLATVPSGPRGISMGTQSFGTPEFPSLVTEVPEYTSLLEPPDRDWETERW